MARTHARIYASIWQDDDFRALSAHAQRVYILALSQPGVSFCGVVSYTAKRWSEMATDTTSRSISKAVNELESAGFVVVDPATEELWIRSFVRHDGVLESPNLTIAMWRDVPGVFSGLIRAAFLYELPDVAWDVVTDGKVEGFPKPIDNPLSRGTATPVPCPSPVPTPQPRSVGTPIPDTFSVDEEMQVWVKSKCPDIDWELHTENFVDWAKSTTSRAAIKKDWGRAWKTWMRREQDKVPQWARNRGTR